MWQSTQRDLENLPSRFVETIEQQKEKKGVTELNLLITKLKETISLGKFYVSIQIHSPIFLLLMPIVMKFLFRYEFQKNVHFHL